MLKFIYVLIGTLAFFSFWYAGDIYRNNKKDIFRMTYWKTALIPISFFSIFYGLRFGRLVDYNVYEERYEKLGHNIMYGEYEYLFRHCVHFMSNLNIPYWFFILLCSVLFVMALMKYLKIEEYKNAMPFILVLAFLRSDGIEQLIRWYLAAVFFLLALSYLREKKYYIFAALGIVSCLFHYGFIIMLPISLMFFVEKSIMSSKVCVILFVLSVFVGETQMLNPYLSYLEGFSINEKADNYINGMEKILNGEFHAGIMEKNFFGKIRDVFMYSFPLLIASKLLDMKLINHSIFNIYKISIILYPVFAKVEILDRYAQILMIMSVPIICGNAFYYLFRNFGNRTVLEQIVGLVSVAGFLQTFFWKQLLSRDEWYEMLFLWDAEGRDALPINYFINF